MRLKSTLFQLAALQLASLLLLGGCAVNPVTGQNELAFVSEQQELSIGQKNYGPYRQAQGGDYVLEPELTHYVQSVGERLAAVSDRKLPYEFSIINDATPNAWALPGGKISINRGLLAELDSEAELAAVLAHEIVHAAARHSAQSMERGVFLQGALIAAGIALGDSGYSDIGMLGANLGAQLTNQKFGRDDETEADLYGMRYMVRAGYDPAAAVSLQETFVRLAGDEAPGWLDGLFASHPPSPERVQDNRRLLTELGNPGGEIGHARYQRAIARIKRNKPAYAAYDTAKKALAADDRATALRKVDEALRIEPDEAAFYTLRGEIKAMGKDTRAAYKDLDRAVALNPGYFRPLLARGVVRRLSGDDAGAAADLRRSAELLPTAEAYYGLGLVSAEQGERAQAVGYLRKAATSQSAVGQRAGVQLAKLDLEANPGRYLSTALGLTQDGYLVVNVSNDTKVAVRDIEVTLGPRSGDSIRRQAVAPLGMTLQAGQKAQLRTRFGPMDLATARRYGAAVSAARLAE
ncbi:MAG: M48 family metalloprotease [Gammaproteobacteria bacterium]|nr:M48 family metalloprotease [Gammaproteobacteria bacterium]